MKLEFSIEECETIFVEGHTHDGKYTKVEQCEWEDYGKYSSCILIIQDVETKKYYRGYITRYGNYFSDYELVYDLKYNEVIQKEVTVLQWVKVD